jgi:hypothetical protein
MFALTTRHEDPGRFVMLKRSSSSFFIYDRFQERTIKFRHTIRAELLHCADGSGQVAAQLPDRNPAANLRPGGQPFLAALVDFYRPREILAGDVQIDDPRLQDPLIKLTDQACFLAPGGFERFMGFEIMAAIE